MARLVHTVSDWQRLRAEADLGRRDVGFVPTLGALHAGHESLLRRSRAENEVTVLSIFLNPTQFDDPNDLDSYPGTLETDLEVARKLEVDYVFCPSAQETYPQGYRYRVSENELSQRFCGSRRHGHFDGVLTVVLKLLLAIRPSRAYFGEKDHQQLELVRGLVRDFFIDIDIVACPTVRHRDGLAVSSRNALLSPSQRRLAPHFAAQLASAESPAAVTRRLEALGFAVDYIEDTAERRYGAVKLGGARLIDNIPHSSRLETTT